MRLILVAALFVPLFASSVVAAEIVVSPEGTADHTSIQAANDASSHGGFAPVSTS